MFYLRQADKRGRTQTDWLDSRHTFSFGQYYDPRFMAFSDLRVINDDVVAPSGGFGTHPHDNMEIVSVVFAGRLEHKDSLGSGSVITPGEVQAMTAGTGIHHSEFNPSAEESVHFLQIWIMPDMQGLEPSYRQQKFAPEKMKDRWCLISCFHQQLRSYTFKIERRNGIRVGQRGVDHHGGRLTFEFDVETFVQFNDFRHV